MGIMGFRDRRRQTKEIEREVRFKQGLSRVRNYVQKCQQSQKRLWELGKRTLKLGDHQQFEHIARAYLHTGDQIMRWERYLVAAESISIQRGQVKATQEFVKSVGALSESMMAGSNPEDLVEMQRDLEVALQRSQTLDETLATVMDATSDTVFSPEGLSEDSLKEVEAAMLGEARGEESGDLDERVSQGLKRIEDEMRKEMK